MRRQIAFVCLLWGSKFPVNFNWEWGFSTDLQCSLYKLCEISNASADALSRFISFLKIYS